MQEFPVGLAQIHSRACVGVEAPQVTVEVHLSGGLPRTQIVGTISPKAVIGFASENFRSEKALKVSVFGQMRTTALFLLNCAFDHGVYQ